MMEQKRVAWVDGMFLRASLFQQQERYLESYIEARTQILNRYFWGFTACRFDSERLQTGKLSVYHAEGIFADGTPFSIPKSTDIVPTLQIREEDIGQVIYLAIPIRQPQEVETVFEQERTEGTLARYVAKDVELYDASSSSRGTQITQLSCLRVHLFTEKQMTDKWLGLPIAKIHAVLSNQEVVLEETFVPPMIQVQAHEWMVGWLQKLLDIVGLRAQTIAQNLSLKGNRHQDTGEVADYLLLQLLNKANAWFQLIVTQTHITPFELYQTLIQLDAELATYVLPETRVPYVSPKYHHMSPYETFQPLLVSLQRSLNQVLLKSADVLLLEDKGNGLSVAICEPSVLSSYSSLVLVVSAAIPTDALIAEFPAQTKIASSNYLPELLRLHLPGVPLKQLPVPPRQLPYHADCGYFELSQKSSHWEDVMKTGSIALHVAGSFPELRVELWGIRSQH